LSDFAIGVNKIESVQKQFTKHGFSVLPYHERLDRLHDGG